MILYSWLFLICLNFLSDIETAKCKGVPGEIPASPCAGRTVHWAGAAQVCALHGGEEPGPSSSWVEPEIHLQGRKHRNRTLALWRVPVSPFSPINSIFFSPFTVSASLISDGCVTKTQLFAELRKNSCNSFVVQNMGLEKG